MADVVVIIPTLGRPHHIKPLLSSLYHSTDRARPLFICNRYDSRVISVIRREGGDILFVDTEPETPGDYAIKINAGYRNSNEPLIFLGATDLKFHVNWLENAEQYITDQIQVVGTNDLGNPDVLRGNHSTHSLLTRKYADDFGTIDESNKILCEEYVHEYVDNEFCETAKHRNAWAMAMDSIVEHMHPAFRKGHWDESYRNLPERLGPSKDTYEKRKHLWT